MRHAVVGPVLWVLVVAGSAGAQPSLEERLRVLEVSVMALSQRVDALEQRLQEFLRQLRPALEEPV